jgi:hypothetical protein
MRGTFSLRPITAEVTAADVRAEAGRRIEAIMPDYKQHNVMVWGVEIMMAYGTDPANWPAAQFAQSRRLCLSCYAADR